MRPRPARLHGTRHLRAGAPDLRRDAGDHRHPELPQAAGRVGVPGGLFIFSDVYRLWSSVLVFLSAAAQIVSGHEGLAQGILKFFVMLSALLRGGRSIMKGLNRGYLYVFIAAILWAYIGPVTKILFFVYSI